jgi:hypothetical protein
LECIVVACIGSVEIFSIQEYASKRDGSLDVSLKVFGVLNPVEGVAGVIAKRACHITWKLEIEVVENCAIKTVLSLIKGVADIELRCIDEHGQFKTHGCNGILH